MPFNETVSSIRELREIMGFPNERSVKKQLAALDKHCVAYIARSPLVLVGTTGANGACDVSPRGDAPGFVQVLDDKTIVLPERPGNRRIDTLQNILATGQIGMLFLIPGVEETLRVNGRACLTRDEAILERCVAHDKRPVIAIGVEVTDCYLHCAKAFKRSRLWQPETWPPAGSVPTLAEMLHDQICPTDGTVEEWAESIQESYAKNLY